MLFLVLPGESALQVLSGPYLHTTLTSYVQAQLFFTLTQGFPVIDLPPSTFSRQFADCAVRAFALPAPETSRSAALEATANTLKPALAMMSLPNLKIIYVPSVRVREDSVNRYRDH